MGDEPPAPGQERGDKTDQQSPDDGIIGEIAPEEGVEEAPHEELPPRSHRRARSRVVGCLLAVLGALVGAGVAVWLSTGGNGDRSVEAPVTAPVEAPAELPENQIVFSPTPERPEATPDIITAETERIYVFYEMGRIPAQAPLSGTWSHESGQLVELKLTGLEREDDVDHAKGRFELHPPGTGGAADGPEAASDTFPPGIYEVELTSPEYPDVVATGSFVALPRAAQVLAGGGDPEGPPAIRSLTTAIGVTGEGEPVSPTSTFTSDVDRVTVVFTYAGIAPGSVLTVRWHAADEEIAAARTEIPINASEGSAEAWLDIGGDDRLPPGEYRVSVHLGDDEQALASTGFSVRESPAGSPGARLPAD